MMMPLSGDHRRPPPPSPPFSSLSPLAAPFTVDRSLLPGSNPHAPTAPVLFSPSVSHFLPRKSVADAAPYYPSYARAADPFLECAADVALKTFAGTEGVDRRAMPPWIGAFEEKGTGDFAMGSSWMDPPSSYGVSPSFKGLLVASDDAPIVHIGDHISSLTDPYHFRSRSSHWLDEQYPEIFKGRSEAFSSGFGSAILEPVTFMNEVSDSLLPIPCSATEASSDFYLSPSYDKYITQLESCSFDPLTHKPTQAHLASTEVSGPVENTATLVDSAVIGCGFSSSQYVNPNPYQINSDYFGYIFTEQKQPGAHSDDKDYHVVFSSPVINPVAHSVGLNYGLGNIELKCTNFPSSELESIEAHSLKKSSSDSADQHNLVDSPCWKGMSSVCQHSFGLAGDNRGSCHTGEESAEYKDFQQVPKQIQSGVQCDSSVSHSGECSSAFSMPDACQKCEYQNVKLFCVEPGGKKLSNMACILAELTHEGKEHLITEVSNVAQVNQQGNVSTVSECARANASVYPVRTLEEAAHISSSNLNPGIEVKEVGSSYLSCGNSDSSGSGNTNQLLIESMHNMSQLLLVYCGSGYVLKQPELEILLSVTENLKAFIKKHKQAELNTIDDMEANNAKSPQDTKADLDYTQHTAEDKHDHYSSEGIDTDFIKCISKAVDKLPEDRLFDQVTGTHALLFKKLWIEAEAALCTTKYELQLARMKLEMENHELVSKATNTGGLDGVKNSKLSALSSNLLSLSSMKGLASNCEAVCVAKESFCTATMRADGGDYTDGQLHEWSTKWVDRLDKQYHEPANKVDEIEGPVLARRRALNGQSYNIDSVCAEELLKLLHSVDVTDYMGTKESVENLLANSAKKQERESNSNKTDEADDRVMARLRVLRGQSDTINSDCSEQLKLLHSVDVRGRVRSKKSVENLLANGAKKQDHESNSIKARRRVLEGQGANINPDCAEEQPKLLHSVDVGGCLVNKKSPGIRLLEGTNPAGSKYRPPESSVLGIMRQNQQMHVHEP